MFVRNLLLLYTFLKINRGLCSFNIIHAGVLKKDSKVWTPNLFGLICGINYFYQFRKHCKEGANNLPGTVSQHLNYGASIIAATAMVAIMLSTNVASAIIGKVGVLFCVILFASPLAALQTVIRTKSAKSIPLPFTLTCILNCFLWTVYGFDMKDFNIYFPNLLGLLSSLAQLALIALYGNGTPHQQLPM